MAHLTIILFIVMTFECDYLVTKSNVMNEFIHLFILVKSIDDYKFNTITNHKSKYLQNMIFLRS